MFLAILLSVHSTLAAEPCDGDNDGYVEDLEGC